MRDRTSCFALVTDAFGGHGGIAQYNRDLMTALVESGCLSSLTIQPRAATGVGSLPRGLRQLPPRGGRLGYSLSVLCAGLFRDVNVVFCGHLFMAPLAALVARLNSAKFVVQLHGFEAWQRPSRLQRAAVEAADLVLCVSRYTRACVLGWASIVPERAIVLPNTVGDSFVPGPTGLRKAWGLEGKKVLLTVGRLNAGERYKGQDRVMRCISDLVAKGHDVVYVVAGQGDDMARLQALAEELQIADRVRFVGSLEREELLDVYRMADLFVMPSTGEGFGIAFLEAMASGTPALGLDVAGARDALADGVLGIAVSEDELPRAVADCLSAPRPDPAALSAAVHARFGRAAFAALVKNVFARRLLQAEIV